MKPRFRLRLHCAAAISAAAISAAFDKKKKRKEKRRAPCLSCVGYYILLFNLSYSSRGSEDGVAALKHTVKGHIFNKPAACTVSNSSWGGVGELQLGNGFSLVQHGEDKHPLEMEAKDSGRHLALLGTYARRFVFAFYPRQ